MSDATVRNVDIAARDLADGRVLAPGEEAEGVDLRDAHNRALLEDGRIVNLDREPDQPKRPSNVKQVEEAKD